jgi:hypothetical protein
LAVSLIFRMWRSIRTVWLVASVNRVVVSRRFAHDT